MIEGNSGSLAEPRMLARLTLAAVHSQYAADADESQTSMDAAAALGLQNTTRLKQQVL